MEPRCSLCGKTVEELAKEELEALILDRRALYINLDSELVFPYLLCNGCIDFLRVAIPRILEAEGIIKFDEKADKYVLTTK